VKTDRPREWPAPDITTSRWRTRGCHWVLLLAALCSSCGIWQPLEGEADDEELLRILAKLAREGRSAICSPSALESALQIRIDTLMDRSRQSIRGRPIVEFSAPIGNGRWLGSGRMISGGLYKKFKSDMTSFCHLGIVFSGRPLCGANSERVQSLMGARVQYLGDTIHAPGQPTVYLYAQEADGEAQISLGSTNAVCTDTLTIRYQGDWQ